MNKLIEQYFHYDGPAEPSKYAIENQPASFYMLLEEKADRCEVLFFDKIAQNKKELSLLNLLNEKRNWTFDEMCMHLSNILLPEITLTDLQQNEQYQSLPDEIKAIGVTTNGFIMFKHQAAKLYALVTGASTEESQQWVKDWNKKIPAARNFTKDITVNGRTLEQIIELLCPYDGSKFFIAEPAREVNLILEYFNYGK
jgi:hypothetical protein